MGWRAFCRGLSSWKSARVVRSRTLGLKSRHRRSVGSFMLRFASIKTTTRVASRIADMSSDRSSTETKILGPFPAAPLTLEGYSILHQMFRVRRRDWRSLDVGRQTVLDDASTLFDAMARREDGESALFSTLGHKGDLMIVHFRRSLDELHDAELAVARLALSDYLEPTTSYLSVIEIGLYEATVALYRRLIENGIGPRSPEWKIEIDAELVRQREK